MPKDLPPPNATKPRRRRLPPEQRRTEIVDTAGRLIATHGIRSLTLRSVADALGVATGLISHYFASVDDLVTEGFAHASTNSLDAWRAHARVASTPLGQLRRLLDYRRHRTEFPVPLLWVDGWQASYSEPRMRDEVVRQMTYAQTIVTEIIAEGVAAGQFSTDNANASASRILATAHAVTIQAVLQNDEEFLRIADFVLATAEQELGLPPHALENRRDQ
ncbi:TetR/AcrR family transcriptional regulator [Nocardia acidivorans]|uniref:TetR/AcrR family transcriptional regulator n=1 Tax=Nocardia acidivorans TaxID=404580 RepID=UPI0009FBCF9B|nr:TetR family transcriptional regulator [Nocardia acidivorans]